MKSLDSWDAANIESTTVKLLSDRHLTGGGSRRRTSQKEEAN
ncbi:MAG: hypothetical protein WAW06_02450 [bacterium]